MPDKLDAAIAAAQAEPAPIAMRQFQVTIESTGRPFALLLPADATDGEVAEFGGWLLTGLLGTLREERNRAAGGRIILPTKLAVPGGGRA